jgi:hypothetical protein
MLPCWDIASLLNIASLSRNDERKNRAPSTCWCPISLYARVAGHTLPLAPRLSSHTVPYHLRHPSAACPEFGPERPNSSRIFNNINKSLDPQNYITIELISHRPLEHLLISQSTLCWKIKKWIATNRNFQNAKQDCWYRNRAILQHINVVLTIPHQRFANNLREMSFELNQEQVQATTGKA